MTLDNRSRIFSYLFVGCILLVAGSSNRLCGQEYEFKNRVYRENIRSVSLFKYGDPSMVPIIHTDFSDTWDLKSEHVVLQFDDLEADYKYYTYTIVHCDRDWTPSELLASDYLTEFEEEEIDQYYPSVGTYQRYTHYSLTLPNEDFGWSKSGNYLLIVYDNEGDDKEVVLTRRFVVVDKLMNMSVIDRRTSSVSLAKTHHELSFRANIKDLFLENPMNTIRATVFQNFDWSTAIEDIGPRRIAQDFMYFDYHNKIIFPAGKPYRIADLRSTRYRGNGVYSVSSYQDGIEVVMETDVNRQYSTPSDDYDLNGSFFIRSSDDERQGREEYLDVLFSLESSNPFYEQEVYLLGAFNEFRPDPAYRMEYIQEEKIYALATFLKQGVYDYCYGVYDEAGEISDYETVEGNWYETMNEYNILIYYRPFGEIYDRVVGHYIVQL